MGKFKKFFILVFAGLVLFVLGGLFWPKDLAKTVSSPSPKVEGEQITSSPSSSAENLAEVARVIDGDTIVLESGEKVRYIGIDSPETYKKNQCFGDESKNKNKELVEGKSVRLEKDISERDRYGRLLRYIYVGEVFVNDYLVRNGYARVSTYPPDVKYQQQFIESERHARENNLGLWSKCSNTSILYSNVASPSPSPIFSDNSIIQPSNINCSQNTYNCSDFKTQAEAQQVFDYCMKLVGYDVHKLDRDHDGRVCETLP